MEDERIDPAVAREVQREMLNSLSGLSHPDLKGVFDRLVEYKTEKMSQTALEWIKLPFLTACMLRATGRNLFNATLEISSEALEEKLQELYPREHKQETRPFVVAASDAKQ